MATQMMPAQFMAKWSRAELSERAASQEHFIDICRMLGQPLTQRVPLCGVDPVGITERSSVRCVKEQPTPAEHDATGAEYTFEKGVAVTDAASKGSRWAHGFADVW